MMIRSSSYFSDVDRLTGHFLLYKYPDVSNSLYQLLMDLSYQPWFLRNRINTFCLIQAHVINFQLIVFGIQTENGTPGSVESLNDKLQKFLYKTLYHWIIIRVSISNNKKKKTFESISECVRIYIYIYICAFRHICKHMYICMHIYIYYYIIYIIYISTYVFMCIYIYIYIYIYICVCVCVCVCVCIFRYTYIEIHINIYITYKSIHTHIYTCIYTYIYI